MEPHNKKGNAYHEAGHVVLGVLLGKRVEFVKLDAKHDDGTQGAYVRWTTGLSPSQSLTELEAVREGMIMVAGYETQDVFARETYEPQSDWSDRAAVTKIARKADLDEGAFDTECRERVKKLLRESKVCEAVEIVAQKIMQEEGQIDGAVLEELVISVAGPPSGFLPELAVYKNA